MPSPPSPTTHPAALCLAAVRHTKSSTLSTTPYPNHTHVRITLSRVLFPTNPSHRHFQTIPFTYLHAGCSALDIADALSRYQLRPPTHNAHGVSDAVRRFREAGLLNAEGVRAWLEWRVASWPGRPAGWEVDLLGGRRVEEVAWAVHEIGRRRTGRMGEEEGMMRQVCVHGVETGRRVVREYVWVKKKKA